MRVYKNKDNRKIKAGNDMKTKYWAVMGSGVAISTIMLVVTLCPVGSAALKFLNTLNSLAGKFLSQIITWIVGLPGNFKMGFLHFSLEV